MIRGGKGPHADQVGLTNATMQMRGRSIEKKYATMMLRNAMLTTLWFHDHVFIASKLDPNL